MFYVRFGGGGYHDTQKVDDDVFTWGLSIIYIKRNHPPRDFGHRRADGTRVNRNVFVNFGGERKKKRRVTDVTEDAPFVFSFCVFFLIIIACARRREREIEKDRGTKNFY